jgi:hypothetical protein
MAKEFQARIWYIDGDIEIEVFVFELQPEGLARRSVADWVRENLEGRDYDEWALRFCWEPDTNYEAVVRGQIEALPMWYGPGDETEDEVTFFAWMTQVLPKTEEV